MPHWFPGNQWVFVELHNLVFGEMWQCFWRTNINLCREVNAQFVWMFNLKINLHMRWNEWRTFLFLFILSRMFVNSLWSPHTMFWDNTFSHYACNWLTLSISRKRNSIKLFSVQLWIFSIILVSWYHHALWENLTQYHCATAESGM